VAVDFQFDATADGRWVEDPQPRRRAHPRSSACQVARSIDAEATVEILDTIAADRGYPQFIRCDTVGTDRPCHPRLVPHLGCRHGLHRSRGSVANPCVESFDARLRDELLAVEQLDSLLEAKVLVADWRIDYNRNRLHSSLGYPIAANYAATWTNRNSHSTWTNNRGRPPALLTMTSTLVTTSGRGTYLLLPHRERALTIAPQLEDGYLTSPSDTCHSHDPGHISTNMSWAFTSGMSLKCSLGSA
jgi:putative transposase